MIKYTIQIISDRKENLPIRGSIISQFEFASLRLLSTEPERGEIH